MGQRHKLWRRILFSVLIVDAVAMIAHDAWIGGSAAVGKAKDGHFFVGARGRYTEVSEAAFNASATHETIAAVVMGLAMFILFFVMLDEFSRSK